MQDAPVQDELSTQTMATHEMADEVRRDGISDQADAEVQPSIEDTPGEKITDGRVLSEGVESAERDTSHLVAAIAVLEERLDSVLKETGREKEILLNEIGSLKGHIKDCAVEKDEAFRIHNSHIQELEGATIQLRQELQSTRENADREKQQFITECEDLKAEVGRVSAESDVFTCDVKGYEKELETLKAEATRLMDEVSFCTHMWALSQRTRLPSFLRNVCMCKSGVFSGLHNLKVGVGEFGGGIVKGLNVHVESLIKSLS
jgi:chromosome segregation ATPase